MDIADWAEYYEERDREWAIEQARHGDAPQPGVGVCLNCGEPLAEPREAEQGPVADGMRPSAGRDAVKGLGPPTGGRIPASGDPGSAPRTAAGRRWCDTDCRDDWERRWVARRARVGHGEEP